MTEIELKERTRQFALRVIKLVEALPKSVEGRALGGQLARSAMSVGANYRAACRGRSKAEFIAKLGIVEEEADESAYWIALIMDAGLLKRARVEPLHQEAHELTAIMAASRITASRRLKSQMNKIQNHTERSSMLPPILNSEPNPTPNRHPSTAAPDRTQNRKSKI